MIMIKNIREMLQLRLSQDSNKLFFTVQTDEGKLEKTYSDLKTDILNLGKSLIERYGNRVRMGLIGENSYHWIVCFYTALYFGWVVVPMDRDLPETGLKNIVQKSYVNILMVGKDYIHKFDNIITDLEQVMDFYIINTMQECPKFSYGMSLDELLTGTAEENLDLAPININEAAVILFSSGTTGISKGVMLSQKNLLSNCVTSTERLGFAVGTEIGLCVLPFHHCYPIMFDMLITTYVGGVLHLNTNLKNLVSDLQNCRPTHLFVVPMIADYLINKVMCMTKDPSLSDEERDKAIRDFFGGRLKTMLSAGALTTEKTVSAYQKTEIALLRAYGLTECSPAVTMMSPEVNDYDLMTTGTPLPCNEVKIVNGEICVRGDNVMIGYYNDAAATAEAFDDKWLRTGDLGYIDDRGNLYITGRIKNVIILESGENVYPEDIEELLLHYDDIQECVVFEYRKENRKPLIAAMIYPAAKYLDSLEGRETKERFIELQNDVNNKLPVYKHILKLFLTAQEFEKTPTRKIIRSKVCERIKKGEQ